MEYNIIQRAMFLRLHFGKPFKESVSQAIEEIADKTELNDLFILYDISKNDYIEYIERKMKGEL